MTGHDDGTAVGVDGDLACRVNVKSHIRFLGEGTEILVSDSEVTLKSESDVGEQQKQAYGCENPIRGQTKQPISCVAAKKGHEPIHRAGVPPKHNNRNDTAGDPYPC